MNSSTRVQIWSLLLGFLGLFFGCSGEKADDEDADGAVETQESNNDYPVGTQNDGTWNFGTKERRVEVGGGEEGLSMSLSDRHLDATRFERTYVVKAPLGPAAEDIEIGRFTDTMKRSGESQKQISVKQVKRIGSKLVYSVVLRKDAYLVIVDLNANTTERFKSKKITDDYLEFFSFRTKSDSVVDFFYYDSEGGKAGHLDLETAKIKMLDEIPQDSDPDAERRRKAIKELMRREST